MDLDTKASPIVLWTIATLMVTIISCCSLVGVSIVPLISGPSYKIFMTLFTGLAVGSLLGSAIFSLIPQAFALNTLPTGRAYLWKSMVIFFGIYLFYCSERLMRIYFDQRTRETIQNEQNRHKKNKSSSSANDAITTTNVDDGAGGDVPVSSSIVDKNKNQDKITSEAMTSLVKCRSGEDEETQINSSRMLDGQGHSHHHHGLSIQETITKALKSDTACLPVKKTEIAPLAWMIIIGDGLHNFIDGLTIGAAFTETTWTGLSTSLAVIFEEFPHELGDFAVLINSGMTVRQALGFNFMSACTCYIGMIFGILLGNLTQSNPTIFALAGGMFLYISLVDMMGELSAMLEESKDSTKESCRLLLMQNLGILTGIIITFVLALVSRDG